MLSRPLSSRCISRPFSITQAMVGSSITDSESDVQGFGDKIISLKDWWTLEKKRSSRRALIDLRSADRFAKSRLVHSDLLLVPFPSSHMKERSYELPARHVEFSILVDPSEVDSTGDFLVGTKPKSRKSKRRPWEVTHVLIDDTRLWEDAEQLGIYSNAEYKDPFPLPRLWQPDPMVAETLLPLLKKLETYQDMGEVWDLASGAGRDVAFLAEELLAAGKPHLVKGFDHRYNAKETGITSGFWERRGVADHTTCIKLDLAKWENLQDSIDAKAPVALFAVRFWKEDLVKSIAGSEKLLPGTIFGLSHFCKPHEGASWDFDHPSEKTVLERNQLKGIFDDGWDILEDAIALDSDHGRTMIQFVARKR